MCDAAGWEAWSYDSRGHVAAERRNTNGVTKSTAYSYNFHGGGASITYPSGRTVTYTYNAAGQTGSASDIANSITYASNAHYNPAGALASLQETGNLTADPVNSSYTYNAEGELTSAAGVTYTYDGAGNRVQKSNGKLYWYGATVDPMAESDSSGNLTAEYIFVGGKRIAMLTLSAGTVNYYVADHLGSSHVVTNSSGTILDDSDFYPFGGERSYSSSSGNNYKFTDHSHI